MTVKAQVGRETLFGERSRVELEVLALVGRPLVVRADVSARPFLRLFAVRLLAQTLLGAVRRDPCG